MQTERSYEFIRRQIEHEDQLVNQRVTWLLTFQGLLFTAFGFSTSARATAQSAASPYKPTLDWIEEVQRAIAIVGVASASIVFLGLCGALLAVSHLKAEWAKEKGKDDALRISSDQLPFTLGLFPPMLLPAAVALGWWLLAPQTAARWVYAACFISLLAGGTVVGVKLCLGAATSKRRR